jgi:hypothetical protein
MAALYSSADGGTGCGPVVENAIFVQRLHPALKVRVEALVEQ